MAEQLRGRAPAGPTEGRVAVAPGVTLHVERRDGDPTAAPFVLVHGLASNVRLWDAVAERLHARGHTVIALDQRGHGRSDAPQGEYGNDIAVRDLRALIGALGLGRPVLAGQSWGANVVLELAWRHPEIARGIVCVDGGIIELANSYPSWEACLAALTPPSLGHLTLAELEARLRAQHPDFSDRAIAAYLHCFRASSAGRVEPRLALPRHLEILRSLWEHRPSTRWATLATPAVLLLADTGEAGRTAGKRRAEGTALASASKIRSQWFVGHHDLHLQFPERIADALMGAVDDGFFA
ncbi:MAG: alpha/beta fold hydrolase [Candidatus Rokuibacteriota bacterium]